MKIYNSKLLTTALSAGVFALGSFTAMNAYAGSSSCLVCWSPDATLCDDMNKPGTSAQGGQDGQDTSEIAVPVMWMSCYEQSFRDGYGAVDQTNCEKTHSNDDPYITWIDFPDDIPGVIDFPDDADYPADNAWWYSDMNCADLREAGYIQKYVPRAASSLTFAPMCVVTNTGSDNEDVEGIGELAPGGTGLLYEACPAN